jgi:hypothetical protein
MVVLSISALPCGRTDLVGGIDPLEIDRDRKGQLDGIFAIAARHGVGLDIHLHEPGEMGLFNCARTRALGLGGKVTISHGFCLGGVTERKAAEAAETLADAGVALVTHGAGGLTMPSLEMLSAAGVLVMARKRTGGYRKLSNLPAKPRPRSPVAQTRSTQPTTARQRSATRTLPSRREMSIQSGFPALPGPSWR